MYGSWMGQFAWTATTLIWMAASFILGIGFTVMWYWLRGKGVTIKWYEWIVVALGVIFLAFMVQNISAAGFEEVQGTVPMFLLVFGLPAILLIGLFFRLIMMRFPKPSP